MNELQFMQHMAILVVEEVCKYADANNLIRDEVLEEVVTLLEGLTAIGTIREYEVDQ